MSCKRILLLNLSNGYFFRRKVHSYAPICESNDAKNVGKHTKIQGWIRAFRKMKESIFLDVNDGSSSQSLQVVMKKNMIPDNLSYGCSISAEGEISVAPNGRPELHAEKLNVIGNCDLEGYPFLPRKQYSQDYIRQYLHIRPRTRAFSSTMRLRDTASNAVKDHFKSRGFINVHTPIITSNDCEGAGEVFFVQPDSDELLKEMKKSDVPNVQDAYFNHKAFLSVSGQLHLEACARSLSKVYNFSPTFRAENSKTRFHLSEFYMIEAEIAFMTSLKELAAEAELLVKSVSVNVLQNGSSDLNEIKAPEPHWLEKDFVYMTYDEAIQILEKHSDNFTLPVQPGENLAREHELFLVQHNDNVPVFVTEWPKNIKPFYMKECENDSSKVQALDLLVPTVGELIGGSVREDNYFKLKEKLPQGPNLEWYLELRKYGNVPTAGFGLGFERYLQLITGIPSIKDVIPFPRWAHNCSL